MNRNFHNSRGSSTHDKNQNPLWRGVLLALVLALAIGSAGQIPLAQAAPTSANDIKFELSIYPEKLPRICVNQKLTLFAGVSKTIFKGIIGPDGKEIPIPGRVTGPEVSGTKVQGVGTLEKVGGSGGSGDELMSLQGENVFTFTSDEPGTATLRFTTIIQDEWVGANEQIIEFNSGLVANEVTVKVGCKKKVTTIGQWSVPGPANIFIAATSDDATVEGDEQGSYKGSTTVNWVLSSGQVGDCVPQGVTTSSQVEWTGKMDDSDQLTLDGTYQSAAMSLPVYCVGSDGGIASGSTPIQLTADPLQVIMLSEGGVFKQPQVLEGPEGPILGSVTIIVVPDEEEAAAFIPGDHQPGWDDFLNLFGALLALP